MILDSTKITLEYTHSKLILIGEHGVVYGKPAIAIPFPLKVRSIIKHGKGPIIIKSNIFTGPIDNIPVKMKGISDTIKKTLNYLKKPFKDLKIIIDSFIPLGRGLGSSAAVATSIVRSLFSYYEKKPSQDELFSLVNIAETYAHGNPSGIDMAAVASDYPIWFKKGKDIVYIKPHSPLSIVVGDTGRVGNTRKAVENVRKRYNMDPNKVKKSLEEIEKIAVEAKKALISGDMYLLGKLLSRNQLELIDLGVSDDGLNRLINTSLDAGALGSKLTGGGIGGCIIAIAKSLNHAKIISDKLIEAGAHKSWYFKTSENTLYTSHKYKEV